MLTAKKKEQQNNNDNNNYVHDQDRWRALANVVMNVRVSYNTGNFMTENLLASQEALRSMESVGQEKIHNYIVVPYARNAAVVGPSKMGPKCCPETSVTKYQSALRSILEQQSLTP